MPLLAKPNSIVVYGDFVRDFEYDYLSGAQAVIYELEDSKTASATVYDKDANKLCDITATRCGDEIKVSYTKTDCSFTVKLAGSDSCTECKAGTDSVVIRL